jgi:hypothetical protein
VGAEVDVVNQVLVLLFAKTFTGEGIAAAEKAPQRPQKHVAREAFREAGCKTTPSVAVWRLRSASFFSKASRSVGFMFLFQMIQSIESRSIHIRFYVFIVFECYGTYFYTSQFISYPHHASIDRSTHGARIWRTKLSSSRFSSHQTSR